MFVCDPDVLGQFRDAVAHAARRAEVRNAVRHLYTAVQDQIDLRRPVCNTSGRCCRFDEFGHRLFVTTMELGAFLHEIASAGRLLPSTPVGSTPGCPFQRDGLCGVHAIRPFGCRIFFCDETSADWQARQYEFFHAELKRLHEHLTVPYFYVEWRQALRVVLENSGETPQRAGRA